MDILDRLSVYHRWYKALNYDKFYGNGMACGWTSVTTPIRACMNSRIIWFNKLENWIMNMMYLDIRKLRCPLFEYFESENHKWKYGKLILTQRTHFLIYSRSNWAVQWAMANIFNMCTCPWIGQEKLELPCHLINYVIIHICAGCKAIIKLWVCS